MENVRSDHSFRWFVVAAAAVLLIGGSLTYQLISTQGREILPTAIFFPNRNYTLTITGPSGLRYCGTISITTADGKTQTRTLSEIGPHTFYVVGRAVSVSFRKCQEDGSLKVEIAANANRKVDGSTSDKYGEVNLNME